LESAEYHGNERLQFSLLKVFLWTGIVAALLGSSRTLGVGLVTTVYMVSWSVVYGITRMTIARRTAVGVSLVLGVIGVTAFFAQLVLDTPVPSFLNGLLLGCLLGPFVGLVMATLLEVVFCSVDAVDEYVHTKRR
jgi:hypothetical protein